MFSSKQIVGAMLLGVLLLVMFGFVLPFLFSAESTIAVLLGSLLLFVLIAVGAITANNLIRKRINEE